MIHPPDHRRPGEHGPVRTGYRCRIQRCDRIRCDGLGQSDQHRHKPRRLGLTSIAFTATGNDIIREFILRYLEDYGVVTDHVARKRGKLTSLAPVSVQPSNHSCTEVGHKAGLSTTMELDLRPSERLQPGGYGPS